MTFPESFFKHTKIDTDDDFFLIDNDGCEIKQYAKYWEYQDFY